MKIFIFFIALLSLAYCHAKEPYKYDLSICVLFQNEAPYLKEWIEYHQMMGVEHFYCFNNLSTDNYLEVLKPYMEAGTVELKDIPTVADNFKTYYAMQCKCYSDCLNETRGISKWVAFIDPDEFFVPVKNVLLTDFLKDYEDYGGLVINWMMFGTSNVKKIPENQLLIETLTQCAEKSFSCNRYIKSIVRPERVSHFDSAHQATYKKGYAAVNTDKFPSGEDMSYCILWNKLRLNHYWTRDEDFFYKVKVPRQVVWGGKPKPEYLFEKMNANQEDLILRYVPELKKKMIKNL